MDTVVVANILTFVGESALFVASTRKNKRDILIFQIVCMALASVSSFLLKGYSGVVMGVLGILRNILSINNIGSTLISYLFIASAVVFGIVFNNNGALGLLAISANVSQSLFILSRKATVKQIRLACSFASLCWTIYNFAIRGYVGAAFSLANALSYLYNALKNKEEKE